jgi:TonB family protein
MDNIPMRSLALFSLLLAANVLAQDLDAMAHRVAAAAGHPEAHVVTVAEEKRLTSQPLHDTLIHCETVMNRDICRLSVGEHGEWMAAEYWPSANGIDGQPVGTRWWLPEARTLVPIRVGGDVKAPMVRERIEPQYPPEARKARISLVIVEAIIDMTGRVVEVSVLQPLPFGLDKSAIAAVRQWRFLPGTLNGKPIDVLYSVAVNFRLDSPPHGDQK